MPVIMHKNILHLKVRVKKTGKKGKNKGNGGSNGGGFDDNDDDDNDEECGVDGFAGGDVFDDVLVMVMLMMIMVKANILMIRC
jgi:hypothetical protein